MKIRAQFDRATYTEDGSLCLTFKGLDRYAGRKLLGELKEKDDKQIYVLDLKEIKSKRSLNQNALFWELCDRLTEATTGKKRESDVEQTYINLLQEANVSASYLMGLPEIERELKKTYRAVRVVDQRDYGGKQMNVYKCYLGSSHFDVKQMTELIDLVMDKLHEAGVHDIDVEGYNAYTN